MRVAVQVSHPLIYSIASHAPEETRTLGERLGQLLQAGQIIALHGDLGAGKTVLTQGIAAGLRITTRVTSPTFTLVNQYATPDNLQLIHIDSYRLGESNIEATQEAATFGLEELLAVEDAIVVIEWAERVATLLPPDYLKIEIMYGADDAFTRQITCTAFGAKSSALLQALIDAGRSLSTDFGNGTSG